MAGRFDRLNNAVWTKVLGLGDVETKDAATRRASQGPAYVFGGQGYTSTWDVDRAVRDGYEKVIWVFKAIDAIADKASSWPVQCMAGTEPEWRPVDDPILPLLNIRANIVEGSAKYFRYRLSSQLLLSKAGVFVEVVPSRGGGVAALNLLPPGKTKPIPDPDTFVSGFEITLGNGDKLTLPAYNPRRRAGVVWIRKPHPTDPYSSVTPLESAGISIDLDFWARLYNRNFLLNDGRSGQLVAVRGQLSPEDAQELKARFSPGMAGAGRTTVIEADAISVQDTAMSPRDAQYAELRGITKEDLLIALGTPESVIGNASGRTFDNADAEKENWLDVTVLPHTSIIESGWDVLTEGGWDDDRSIVHDVSREPVLRRAYDRRVQQAAQRVAEGLLTIDEFREIADLEPLRRPASQVLWIPGGKIGVGEPAAEQAVAEMKSAGVPSPAPPTGPDPRELQATARAGAIAGAQQAADRRLQLVKGDPIVVESKVLEGDAAMRLPAIEAAGRALADAAELKKYNAKQPRYPKGHPKGGQWMDEGDVALWLAGKPLKGGFDSSKVGDPNKGSTDSPVTAKGADGAERFLDSADPEVAAAAKMLAWPSDYEFPMVLGAPPAQKLAAKKSVKVVSLRKGDVVTIGGKQYAVAANKAPKGGGGEHELRLVDADGGVEDTSLPGGANLTAVARTPHPAQVAAAKKVLAAADDAGTVPAKPDPDPEDGKPDAAGTPKKAPEKAPEKAPPSPAGAPSLGADDEAGPATNYPKPPTGALVYVHPQGKVAYVDEDGELTVWKPDGKKGTSSATPGKLANGHGKWEQVDAPPGWVRNDDWTFSPAPSEPVEEFTDSDLLPGVEPPDDEFQPTPVSEAPNPPVGLYSGPDPSGEGTMTLEVMGDGTGHLTYSDGYETDIGKSQVWSLLENDDWEKEQDDSGPDLAAAVADPNSPATEAASVAAPALPADVAEKLGGQTWQDVLNPPADYPYPAVEGAGVAKTLKAPKPVKVQSLYKGDVVTDDSGDNWSVESVKKSGGTYSVTLIGDSGQKLVSKTTHNDTYDVVARAPHPSVVAAAKKAKALQGQTAADQAAAAAARAGTGEPVYKSSVSGATVVVHPDGTGTLTEADGTTSTELSAGVVASIVSGAAGEHSSVWSLQSPTAPQPAAGGPAPGKYLPGPDGVGELTVHEDGTGTIDYAATGGSSQDLDADEVAQIIAAGGFAPAPQTSAPAEGGDKHPAAGSWLVDASGFELIVHDDGTGTYTSPSGVTMPASAESVASVLEVAEAGGGAAGWTVQSGGGPALPTAVPGVYTDDGGWELTVHRDGSGTLNSPNPNSGPSSIPPEQVQAELASGAYSLDPEKGGGTSDGAPEPGTWTLPDGNELTVDGSGGEITGGSVYDPQTGDSWTVGADEVADLWEPGLQSVSAVQAGPPDGATLPPGVYQNYDGSSTYTLHPDGTATVLNASGHVTELDAADTAAVVAAVGHHLSPKAATLAAAAPAPPADNTISAKPGQVWVASTGTLLTVHEDGTSTMTSSTGSSYTYSKEVTDEFVASAATGQTSMNWTLQSGPGVTPAEVADTVDLDVSKPTAGQPGSILDYPADYPYPVVAGAPPATALAAPKQIKVTSLRNGDVVEVNGTAYSISKVKKLPGGSYEVHGKSDTDGPVQPLSLLAPNETMKTLARTPHPAKVAAAKKAKQQAGADQAGPQTSTSGSAYPDTPAPGSTPAPLGPESSIPDDPPPPQPPAQATVGTLGPIPPAALAAAKNKYIGSKMFKAGAYAKLPNGVVAQLAGPPSNTWQPGKGGAWEVLGYPSVDSPDVVKNQVPDTPGGPVVVYTSDPDHPAYVEGQMPVYSGQWYLIPKAAMKGVGKPAVAPGAAPPVVTPPPTTVTPDGGVPHVDTAGWVKVGAQGGSNLGGMFAAPNGDKFYVKAPSTDTHVDNEVAAIRLYKAAGVKVPDVSKATLHGQLGSAKKGVASAIVDGPQNLTSAIKGAAYKKKVQTDFAVHAWLANWDAVGLSYDNMKTDAAGDPVMIDAGGSLLYRAQGSPKGSAFGDEVTELSSMLNPGMNNQTATIFAGLKPGPGDENFVAGVKKVLAVSPAQVDQIVDQTYSSLGAADRDALKAKLKARRAHLAKVAGLELPENVKPKAKLVSVDNGTARPYDPKGKNITAEEVVTASGESVWWHSKAVGANSLKAGDVIQWLGEPTAPYVVTKLAVHENSNSTKPKVWGKKNGVGEEMPLFVAQPSSGERDVQVLTDPPPGWQPPPPPPPPVPGEKLVPRATKFIAEDAPENVALQNKAKAINASHNRHSELTKAFGKATPEQKAALAAVGLGTPAAFAQHFGSISSQWDGSSNDSNAQLLAFHHAVAAEFGLDDTVAWSSEVGSLKKSTQEHLKKYGPAYQAAARLMWAQTQEVLAKADIDFITVKRGMSFSSGYGAGAPEWAKSAGKKEGVKLRPLSSFTWDSKKAFGGVKVSASVPRELIFSLNGTGPGTDYENEMVILGASNVKWQVSNPVKAEQPDEAPADDAVWMDLPAAASYPSNETEDWLKGAVAWPYVDADGDPVTSIAELADLYPTVDPAVLLTLPVAQAMPLQLRLEIQRAVDDPADDAIVAPEGGTSTVEVKAAGPGSSEPRGWAGL